MTRKEWLKANIITLKQIEEYRKKIIGKKQKKVELQTIQEYFKRS